MQRRFSAIYHCTFATLLGLSSGAPISVKLSNATSQLAMLVSITKSLVKAREKFLLGIKLPVIPWSGIAVNLIGPWKVNIGGRSLIIKALTTLQVNQLPCVSKIVGLQDTRDLFE
jgi:hypothetical protein